jgi:hypothetical protein
MLMGGENSPQGREECVTARRSAVVETKEDCRGGLGEGLVACREGEGFPEAFGEGARAPCWGEMTDEDRGGIRFFKG